MGIPPHDDRECPLNKVSFGQVVARSVVLDETVSDEELFWQKWLSVKDKSNRESWPPTPTTAIAYRNYFFTRSAQTAGHGLLGLGPFLTKPDDEVWAFQGATVPYILRPNRLTHSCVLGTLDVAGDESGRFAIQAGETVYHLIGECFILGLMKGELMDM